VPPPILHEKYSDGLQWSYELNDNLLIWKLEFKINIYIKTSQDIAQFLREYKNILLS
jgi:hypothetical protein